MSAQAGKISASNLHDRLKIRNETDELGHLAKSFNELLDRLDASFEQQHRFMADASHELRTPVAILRGEAEVSLSQEARSPEDYRESLGIVRAEPRRVSQIVDDLFTLARAGAGQQP
jgi:signal transduction histidine kinase